MPSTLSMASHNIRDTERPDTGRRFAHMDHVKFIGGASGSQGEAEAMNNRKQGIVGEALAVDFLVKKGYRIIERNYRYERGEIDLIAEDGAQLVFVEVKARRSKRYGMPEDAITKTKCEKLWKVALGFLAERGREDSAYRFDVVAIEYVNDAPVIRHLVDAF